MFTNVVLYLPDRGHQGQTVPVAQFRILYHMEGHYLTDEKNLYKLYLVEQNS
jgi:hypothetical protein